MSVSSGGTIRGPQLWGCVRGSRRPVVQVYGPVLRRQEVAFFSATANYARLYGGDGSYTTTGLLVLGSPGFMIGAFAASGMTPMVWCGR